MSLAAHMLDDAALRSTASGVEVDVHLPWYRSLPLSSVKTVELVVNGSTVPRGEITFVRGGAEYALDDLPHRWDEVWFVLDPATLKVHGVSAARGEETQLTVRIGIRIPYILIGPDRPLEVVTEVSRQVVAG